jgi:serine---pyruvate transaminase
VPGSARLPSSPYPPLYSPFKIVSLWLVPKLRDSRLSSNAVTVTWGLLLVAAALALAYERVILTGVLVFVAILLDCIDGDLARCRNQPSVSGTLLEQLAHWIGNMSLIAGAGAALLLDDPRPGNVLLVSVLTVLQAIYIAVVRQIRPTAANIPEHPRLRRIFRLVVRVLELASPIEIPIVATLIIFGPGRGVLLALAVAFAVASLLIFVPHFFLIRAVDRRNWGTAPKPAPSKRAGAVARRLPEAHWWVPGTPRLPGEVLTLLGAQPVTSRAPFVATARRDLDRILPGLFRTTGRVLPLACPEEAALEALMAAVSRPGDRILIAGGRVAVRRWRPVIERLGMDVTVVQTRFGEALDGPLLADKIARAPAPDAVLLAMADPEDGTLTDLPSVLATLRESPSMVFADATLSLCADDLRMDEWGVDAVIASGASGVMAPPGLSLVALGSAALAAVAEPEPAGPRGYLDLRTHLGSQPSADLPAAAMLGLHLSVSMIHDAGLDAVIAERRQLAERFRGRCAEDGDLMPVADLRSAACTVFALPQGVSLARLQENLFAAARIVIGYGRTPDGTTTLNVGHSGHLGVHDMDWAAVALVGALRMSREAAPAATF